MSGIEGLFTVTNRHKITAHVWEGSKLTSCICIQGEFGFCGRAVSYSALLKYHCSIPCAVPQMMRSLRIAYVQEGQTNKRMQEGCMLWTCLG